jgi:aspartyl/glutamyl-tRNA(Asn/Gln) amidotransferase C subunit
VVLIFFVQMLSFMAIPAPHSLPVFSPLSILAYFTKIDEVDTKDVPPSYHVLDLFNVFRKDEVKPYPHEEIFRIVPQTKGKFVKAPRMA